MFYVSFVTEYPIYEPAEGGYYYAGETVESCEAFQSWKKANRYFQRLKREFKDLFAYEDGHFWSDESGGCGKYRTPAVYFNSKYIGDGARIQITRKVPIDVGYQPYC